MADTKITALTALTGADPANDVIPIVDVSDTTMAASGTTKKISVNNILGASGTATLASATISGDLTVKTNVLKVDTTNNRVGIGTATPARPLDIVGSFQSTLGWVLTGTPAGLGGATRYIGGASTTDSWYYNAITGGSHLWAFGESLAMTLNSTGLGVGVTPELKLRVDGPDAAPATSGSSTTNGAFRIGAQGASTNLCVDAGVSTTGGVYGWFQARSRANYALNYDIVLNPNGGNVGIGVTPSAWAATFKPVQIGSGTVSSAFVGQTNSPVARIMTNSYFDGTNFVKVQNNTAGMYVLSNNQHEWHNATTGTGTFSFTQAMTLDASGNLLVGTTTNTDAYRTNIQFSGTSVNGLIVKNLASTGGPVLLYLHDSAQTVNTATVSAEYTDSTTQRWRLYKNGGLANYQANNVNLSDVRTKTDIKPLGSYWNKIKSLEVVTFKYKDQTHSDDNIGLIAQQVESVAPELVDADGFGNTPEDGVPLKTIYTTDLYHAAIKALQEAMARIEALEAKLA